MRYNLREKSLGKPATLSMKNSFFDYLIILLKGVAMGAADVVPGVSGGTIAFIAGIYERWVGALSSIGLDAFKKLFNGGGLVAGIKAAWQHIDGSFLLALFGGIAISLFSLAKVIKWLMANQPIALWSFFFGLVIASIVLLWQQMGKKTLSILALFVFGAVAAAVISLLPAASGGQVSHLYLFFAGALAICAMVLPGVSGSFILVLIGAYETFIHALSDIQIGALISFGAGAAIGLMSFARLLKWLFARYHTATLSLMTGFVAGSLVKIWPWKMADGIYPAMPQLGVATDQVGLAAVAMLAGFAVIVVMEGVARKLKG